MSLRLHARPLPRSFACARSSQLVLPAKVLSRTLLLQTYTRALSTTSAKRNTSAAIPADAPHTAATNTAPGTAASSGTPTTYVGPLTPTFRRLKIFSLSSLTLSFTLTPFLFLIESALPASARIALAATALATSGVSTYLVAWCGRPYVSALRRVPAADEASTPTTAAAAGEPVAPDVLEMTTLTLALHPRVTRVFDPAFLVETKRPFAKYELAERVVLPADQAPPPQGSEETIAETLDAKGDVIGRWVVRWCEGGLGECREAGKVVRHFNIHEELLDRPIHS